MPRLRISDPELAKRIADVFASGQLTKATVGLGNADNTSDANKPISSAAQSALNAKVNSTRTVNGQALSTDVTLIKSMLAGSFAALSGSQTLPAWETVYIVSATAGVATITLPSSLVIGQYLCVLKADASSNAVNIVPSAGKFLNGGVGGFSLTAQWNGVLISNDGASDSYTVTQPGGGGSGTGFTVVGIGTTSPAASLDIETWQRTAAPTLLPNNGPVLFACDEFGYPAYLAVAGLNNVSCLAPFVARIDGVDYTSNSNLAATLALERVGSVGASQSAYLFVDSSMSTLNVNNVAPTILSKYYLPGAFYLSFERGLWNPNASCLWVGINGDPTFSTTTVKFGSKSLSLAANAGIQSVNSDTVPSDESGMRPLLANALDWMMDYWIYPTGSFTTGATLFQFNSITGAEGIRIKAAAGNTITMDLPSSLAISGVIVPNSWNYIGVRSGPNAGNVVNLNGTITTGAYSQVYNSTGFQSGQLINVFTAPGVACFIDEIICTPFFRAWQSATAFDVSTISLPVAPCASLFQNASLTDAYGMQWFASNYALGPTFNGKQTLALTGLNHYYCPAFPTYINRTSGWTIEMWANITGAPGTNAALLDLRGNYPFGYKLVVTATSLTNLQIRTWAGNTNSPVINGTNVTIVSSAWNHLAITFSTISGYNIFVNGVSVATNSSTLRVNFGPHVYIGGRGWWGTGVPTIVASIGEFRVSPFVVYTGNFTPGALSVICERDVFDTTTQTYLREPTMTPVAVSYIGAVCNRLGDKSLNLRHFARPLSLDPSIKSNNWRMLRDNAHISPKRSWSFPVNRNSCSGLCLALLRGDGKIAVVGNGDTNGLFGVSSASGAWNEYLIARGFPTTTQITKIALGNYSILALDSLNNVWVVGRNGTGQLGIGSTSAQTGKFVLSYSGTNVTDLTIGTGYDGSIDKANSYILDNGNIYACGYNANGQLGVGDTINKTVWTLVPRVGGLAWLGMYATINSLHAWNSTGLYACGYNGQGNLGIGSISASVSSLAPCVCADTSLQITDVKKVLGALNTDATTTWGTVALTNSGDLFVCGTIGTNWLMGSAGQFLATPNKFFSGPIREQVQDVVVCGGLSEFSMMILTVDQDLLYWGSNTCGFNSNPSVGPAYNWERVSGGGAEVISSVAQIYGNANSYRSGFAVRTHDGRVYLAGTRNYDQNSLGGPAPYSSAITTVQEIVLPEPVKDVYFNGVTNISVPGLTPTLWCYTLLQTESGRIWCAGAQIIGHPTYNIAVQDFKELELPTK